MTSFWSAVGEVAGAAALIGHFIHSPHGSRPQINVDLRDEALSPHNVTEWLVDTPHERSHRSGSSAFNSSGHLSLVPSSNRPVCISGRGSDQVGGAWSP